MSYTIDGYGFVRWEGVRPQYVRQKVQTFAKPGANNIAAQLQGIRGEAFSATLTAVFTTEANTRLAEVGYRNYIGIVKNLIYEGTNYGTTYNTNYLVQDVVVQSAKQRPRLIGPTYDYLNGWELISQWTFVPIAI